MPNIHASRVLEHLRKVANPNEGGLSDAEALGLFIERHDELAFAELVRRHGPMVWGVCRRVLVHAHDAEDAFQATFLVLVRRARAVVPRAAVGNWLYGVAYRTALKARSLANRRGAKEALVTHLPEPASRPPDAWDELKPLLDDELSRLPDRYRLPVVLCDLEGRSRKDVARQLKIPEGTLSSRLTTARKTLARKLARRGVDLSVGTLVAVLGENAASAVVPAPVATATVRAAMLATTGSTALASVVSTNAILLTEGVVRTMLLTKVKLILGLVILMVPALGAATWGYHRVQADESAVTQTVQTQVGDPVTQQPQEAQQQGEERKQEASRREREEQRRKQLEQDRDLLKEQIDFKSKQLKALDDIVAKLRADEGEVHARARRDVEAEIAKLRQQQEMEAEERRVHALEMDNARLHQVFAGGHVDVYIDGNTERPFIKGARFDRVVEMSGKRFLQFVQEDKVRRLIDPARIVGLSVSN